MILKVWAWIVDLLNAIWTFVRVIGKAIILGIASIFSIRARAVFSKSMYDLAITEMSRTLGKPPPPGATIFDKMAELLEHLPEATAILEAPPVSAFAIENPIQGMKFFNVVLKGGLRQKGPIPARVIRYVDEFMADDSISDAQKEKIFTFAVDSYLVGHLAPVAVLDKFSGKLEKLLLKTKYRTNEEVVQELLRAQAQNTSYAQMIHAFEFRNKQLTEKMANISKKVESTGKNVNQLVTDTGQLIEDLTGVSEKVETTGTDVAQIKSGTVQMAGDVIQIKEQTAGIPYFVDQDTKEARADFQRINALKISLGLEDIEQKILNLHEQKCTQQQIADKLEVHIRTVQRYVAGIEKKFSDRDLPSPFVWNNRKKISEE